MEQQIREWANLLTVDKSPATVEGYVWDVRDLIRAVPKKHPGDYTTADLSGYIADRRRAGISNGALKRSVASFRSFFGFCKMDIAKAVPFPRPKRKRQRTPDEDQLLSIMATLDSSSEMGVRNLAIICLMVDTGLRSQEVCRLELSNVDISKRRLFVVVKGGDEKMGVFSDSTAEFLRRWLDVRARRARRGVSSFFVSLGGHKTGQPLTTSGLRVLFRRIGREAGLPSGFSPHDLRRAFATMATRLGSPARVLMVAGRWENEAQLRSYTQDLTAHDFEKYSPVEALLGRREPDS